MTQNKYDMMIQTFIDVVLMPNLNKDEPDASYEIRGFFKPESFKINFMAIKRRNPKYAISSQKIDCGSYDCFMLEKWFENYMIIKAKLKYEVWE